MTFDLTNIESRKEILKTINSPENVDRKRQAFRQYEIFNSRIKKYVVEHLQSQFDDKTVKSMPIISSVNIAKRMIKQEASIYRNDPDRVFSGVSESDRAALGEVYKDGRFNSKLKKANEFFKLFKDQCVAQVLLKDRKVQIRILSPHQFDVLTDPSDSEKALVYIISNVTNRTNKSENRYTVWSDSYNFIMNGSGDIVGDAGKVKNEIGVLPFVDISNDKEFFFFVNVGETDADFTVEYNAALSDLQNICRLQGYAQAVYIGDPKAMPESIKIGPNVVLRIPVNPNQPVSGTDFKYVTPNPDIEGSIKQIEQLLANYLTSRGLDTKSISGTLQGGESYASGFERLLAMMDRFEASKDDIAIFSWAEIEVFKIVTKWLAKYSGTDHLDKKYSVNASIESATLAVSFGKPESVKTDAEKIADIKSRIDLGIADEVTALMEIKGMTEDQAMDELKRLKKRRDLLKAMRDPEQGVSSLEAAVS